MAKKKAQQSGAADVHVLASGMAALSTNANNTAGATTHLSKSQKKKLATDNVITHFDANYGQDKLKCWQDLSRDLGIEVGSSLTQCKKNLKRVHCNIYDFVEARAKGELPRRFRTVTQLRGHIEDTGKFFPLKKAKASPILQWMLISVYR